MAAAVPFFGVPVRKGCGKCKCDTGDFRITVESLKVETVVSCIDTMYYTIYDVKSQ